MNHASPRFTEHQDGRVTVDHFPDEIVITHELLRAAKPELVRRTGYRTFRIECANAAEEYRMVRRGEFPGTSVCQTVRR